MLKLISVKNIFILLLLSSTFVSCKNGGIFGKKKDQSSATGWNYDDKNYGNFHVIKNQQQKAGPGLVFVQGGTFTMGAREEDVMGDWNNVPRRVSINSFYIDETEVANVHYREYMYWLSNTFDNDTIIMNKALPDTLVWRSELAYNEPYVEYYFRYPAYNYYPVVGVTWQQAHDFCIWRTDRVNEKILIDKGYLNKRAPLAAMKGGQADQTFNTDTYIMNPELINNKSAPKKGTLKDVSGRARKVVTFEDGILLPGYRLPTEAEWEYAAYGMLLQNPNPRKKESKTGEEVIANQQVYAWSNNINGLRDNRRGSWQGRFLANFKRGNGDNMGVAGGLNDRAAIPGPTKAFYPNGFGVYNMSGNVSEWVGDVYRPMTQFDADDFNPFRGNKFEKFYKNEQGEYERDTTGRLKKVDVTDSESVHRRNYQRGNVINFLDGDSLSGVSYGYGETTLISDKSRVVKGGSWNDRPYWLAPGSRRYLEEDQAASTIGFRCAMTRLGSPEGNGLKEGNMFGRRKQNSRKKS
ncbi:MAG: SUMF1/EgtB/PvdO family nonheme iron enzyme [Chitinophagaceae bacterium]|nr:SUMF1/EgtB/PvdO family nonheme iron enzyme [Chitinophagaceae bacterium]